MPTEVLRGSKKDPLFFPGEQAFFTRRPRLTTFDWARKHFRVVSGPHKGRFWDEDLIPYAKGIMEAFDQPWVRKVIMVAPSQSAKTTLAYACLGAFLCRTMNRGPAGVSMPDEDAVRRIFANKLVPHFQSSPALSRELAQRWPLQATEIKLKDGADVIGIWTGSESKMSSVSLQVLLIDEEDAYNDPGSVGVLEERVIAYAQTSKILRFSKPRGLEEQSTIWAALQSEAQAVYRYEIRCPLCRAYQEMDFEQIRVPDGVRDPKRIRAESLAWYECPHCQYKMRDHQRNRAVSQGRWTTPSPARRPSVVGFHWPSWVSPFVSLSKVMSDWFRTKDGGPKAWTWFDNSHRAVPGKAVVTETSEDALKGFVVPGLAPLKVPERAMAVTVAADTQRRHWWYSVCAHAVEPREEWIIDQGTVDTFEDLTELIFNTSFAKENSDERLSVWRAAVDTGGSQFAEEDESRTQQVYQWLLKQRPGVVFGTKGMSRKSPGVHVKFSYLQKLPNGKNLRSGLKLYLLDTDAFKDDIFWRLSEESTEPIWFHSRTGEDYFRQLLSEKKVYEKNREVWKQVRRDNHFLDCLVGHMAMSHFQWSPCLQAIAARLQRTEDRGQRTDRKKPNPPPKVELW